jgi:hypothetical protein
VRVFYISAPTMGDLVDRLALVLGEHMHDDDELHVTYNAMQAGWTNHPPTKGHLIRPPQQGWIESHFEYSPPRARPPHLNRMRCCDVPVAERCDDRDARVDLEQQLLAAAVVSART